MARGVEILGQFRSKRTRNITAGAGAVAALLAVALVTPTAGPAFNAVEKSVAEKTKDFLSLIDKRSPGERTVAQLAKAKKRVALSSVRPSQRALSQSRKPAMPQEFIAALMPPAQSLPELDLSQSPVLAALGSPTPAAFAVPPVFVPPVVGGGGGGGGGPPGGGGSPPGGGPPPGPPSAPPPPVMPAIPEPSTWLMMLFGFGTIGWVLRREGVPIRQTVS